MRASQLFHAEVPWHCIYCGATRGEPFMGLSFDGSRRLRVTQWDIPCRHIETYVALRKWLALRDEIALAQDKADER